MGQSHDSEQLSQLKKWSSAWVASSRFGSGCSWRATIHVWTRFYLNVLKENSGYITRDFQHEWWIRHGVFVHVVWHNGPRMLRRGIWSDHPVPDECCLKQLCKEAERPKSLPQIHRLQKGHAVCTWHLDLSSNKRVSTAKVRSSSSSNRRLVWEVERDLRPDSYALRLGTCKAE